MTPTIACLLLSLAVLGPPEGEADDVVADAPVAEPTADADPPAPRPEHDLPPREGPPSRWVPTDAGQREMKAGKITMITGGALMAVGVALFFGGVYGTSDFGSSLDLVVSAGILGIVGAPTLIAGGVVYGVGKRRARQAGQARLVTPTLLVGRDGAQLGVAFGF